MYVNVNISNTQRHKIKQMLKTFKTQHSHFIGIAIFEISINLLEDFLSQIASVNINTKDAI